MLALVFSEWPYGYIYLDCLFSQCIFIQCNILIITFCGCFVWIGYVFFMQGYICVCVLAYSDWLITDSVVAHASMSVFSHHRDGFSFLHLEYSTVPVKVFWAQIQTICVLPPFNSLQENENGGYCSTENAIREWRAYGPELSHEDFTKFHEVSYQYIHKKTHFLSCTTQFSNDDLQSYFFHSPCDIIHQKFKFPSISFPPCIRSTFFIQGSHDHEMPGNIPGF